MSYGVVDFAESWRYNRYSADTVNISNIKTAVVFPTMGIWVDRVFGFELSVVEMNDMVSERGEFSISMCFFKSVYPV
jgi:hypothetical protein